MPLIELLKQVSQVGPEIRVRGIRKRLSALKRMDAISHIPSIRPNPIELRPFVAHSWARFAVRSIPGATSEAMAVAEWAWICPHPAQSGPTESKHEPSVNAASHLQTPN